MTRLRSFGLYLFTHEENGTDPRNAPEVRRLRSAGQLADWFSDLAFACRAARLGIK